MRGEAFWDDTREGEVRRGVAGRLSSQLRRRCERSDGGQVKGLFLWLLAGSDVVRLWVCFGEFGWEDQDGGFYVLGGGKVLEDADETRDAALDCGWTCGYEVVEGQNEGDLGNLRRSETGWFLEM